MHVTEDLEIVIDNWIIGVLEIDPTDYRYNYVNRFEINNGKWMFNDYYDFKMNQDVMKHSMIYVRHATNSEIEVYELFNKLKSNLENMKSLHHKTIG